MTGAAVTHELTLETFESIVPGGVRRVTWLLETEEDWTVIGELPHARVEHLDCGPGVVWRRRVVLTLAVGARLMRVESVPKRGPAMDPLAYLLGPSARAAGRETRRAQFVVAAGGTLSRLPPPTAPKPRTR